MRKLNSFPEGRSLLRCNGGRGLEVYPTGSRYIGGWSEHSDYDYIVYSDRDIFVPYTFQLGGSVPETSKTKSYKSITFSGEINIIVCSDRLTYKKWVEATEVCKFLDLHDKERRVAMFESITNETSVS